MGYKDHEFQASLAVNNKTLSLKILKDLLGSKVEGCFVFSIFQLIEDILLLLHSC